jgi:hypothetical protein
MAEDKEETEVVEEKVDVAAMTAQIEALSESIKKLEAKNSDLIAERRADSKKRNDAELEAASSKGDIEAITKSWQDKFNLLNDELTSERESIATISLDSLTQSIAAEIAKDTNASFMLAPHIRSRLSHNRVDGKYITSVIDAHGKPSALTIAELTAEMRANPVFADLIAGTKATGSGGVSNSAASTKSFTEMSGSDLVALKRQNPEAYTQLRLSK